MIALIDISPKSASTFNVVRKFLPKQLAGAEVITKLASNGYVRNMLKINVDSNDALEGLHDVNSKMGNASILFVTTCGVVMESYKGYDAPNTLGFWTSLLKTEKVTTDTFFMDGQRFTIGGCLI